MPVRERSSDIDTPGPMALDAVNAGRGRSPIHVPRLFTGRLLASAACWVLKVAGGSAAGNSASLEMYDEETVSDIVTGFMVTDEALLSTPVSEAPT